MEKFRFSFSFPNRDHHIRMIVPKPCTDISSKSALLSIADYIIQNFPFLKPPFKYDGEWPQPQVTEAQPWQGNIFHPFYEMWQDVLMERVTQGHALRYQNTLFVDILLNENDQGTFKIPNSFDKVLIPQQKSSSSEKIAKIFELPYIEQSKKKYLIMATHHFQRDGFPFSMRICKDAILLGALFDNQTWKIIYFGRGKIPSAEEILMYDAIMLPGSGHSVLDWTPEMQQYFENIRKAMELNPLLRVIGICFGFQALAQFFGGKVEKTGRKGGIERIQFDQTLFEKYRYLRQLPQDEPWLVSEHHEDQVSVLPDNFVRLGRSQSCGNEGMIGMQGRVVGLQFHSEYFPKYTKVYQDRHNYYYKKQVLTNFYLPSSPEIENSSMAHSLKFYAFFKSFIRGDI